MVELNYHEDIRPGYQVGPYTLLERIGMGGQAVVWSAWEKRSNRVVALKLTAIDDDSSAESGAFSRQSQLIASLEHPGILPVYGFGETSTLRYISMRYIASGSMADLLWRGPLSPLEVLRLATQIAHALDYIHMIGIVHRDLKPTNILLDTQKRAYLTDFGVAKPVSTATQVFHTGKGTAPYAPPEQHTLLSVTQRSDIYSLGVMLYEMFTGHLPWNGSISLAVRQLDTHEELPDPRKSNPALPPGLAEALRTLTAADMTARPATALDAIDLVVEGLQHRGLSPDTGILIPQQPENEEVLVKEDAQHLMSQVLAKWEPETERLKLTVTNYMLIDTVYSNPDRHGLTPTDSQRQAMLQGALIHGYRLDQWRSSLTEPALRLQVYEWAIINERGTAAERAVDQLYEESGKDLIGNLSSSTLARIVDMAVDAADTDRQEKALDILGRSVPQAENWQPTRFSLAGDVQLAALALGDGLQAMRAARLIGETRSEAAVQALLDAHETTATTRALSALVEVLAATKNLPRSTPARVRLQVGLELARRQILEDRPILVRAYLVAALGSALGLGFHTYATYRLPRLLDSARILNALGSGLLFGLVIGLGIFLTRLIVHRLRVLSPFPRIALGVVVGTLTINLGFVSYHTIFLDAAPIGWLIAASSALIALGFGLSARFPKSLVLRVLVSATAIGLGIASSWQMALVTFMTPIFFYEINQPRQTYLFMSLTSLLIGAVAHVVDLSEKPDPVPPS